jgi:alanyl-tRNA synthetase
MPKLTGNHIRQQFIDFFVDKYQHTRVPSASLVPGGDATLLFTNSGMVQFKDVFLGTDQRPYTRAVNSQKCMRVAGKHNDLEDVGFDDTHHTFFEMLGNWSFGDYYKKEAIAWAWELLTEVWKLPKDQLYVTAFKDERGEIPTDDEAAQHWLAQPGLNPDHLIYLGRKDNFWEMADTGPCGPNSEIHIDRGPGYGELTTRDDGQIDLDGPRFLELWNLVFIQYNRTGPNTLQPLPAMHVDTGMGLERIVSVLQEQRSNYATDLFTPIIGAIQELAGHQDPDVQANFTPYRVIADHVRGAAFLIADGVNPGNIGRNYVTRMVIRRAARFGGKLGLNDPFMAVVAQSVIEEYGDAYPELVKNKDIILQQFTREEQRFQKTVEGGIAHLDGLIAQLQRDKQAVIPGKDSFELYATHGLPLEITRDIAGEHGLTVDEPGFQAAMEEHRIASGGGKAMGALGGEDAERYGDLFKALTKAKKLPKEGVAYNPYDALNSEGEVLALVVDGEAVESATAGDAVDVILPETAFYVASGGQIADTGEIVATNGTDWHIRVDGVRRPAAGLIAHFGEVVSGNPAVGDRAAAHVDAQRRQDIIRNHTATHLLHAALHRVLGEHARQAGSLVAPDRLRFDFTHGEAVTKEQLRAIEDLVNGWVLDNWPVVIEFKPLKQAKEEGAIALFGEKYDDTVRTVQIGDEVFSYELCGGTHVARTGEIGTLLITSEGSAAAGIRRIEAVTGRAAYELVRAQLIGLREIVDLVSSTPMDVTSKVFSLLRDAKESQKELHELRNKLAHGTFEEHLGNAAKINGVEVLAARLPGADRDTLREMSDRFRNQVDSGVVVLASDLDGKPAVIAALTKDLVDKGWKAGELVNVVAERLGGSGGGRPDMAQAGGKDASQIDAALGLVAGWVKDRLKE